MNRYSTRQIATLRYFSHYPMSVNTLRAFNQVTIASLFHQELLEQRGNLIGPTAAGFELLDEVKKTEASKRRKPQDIAPSLKSYVRTNVQRMRRVA